MKRSQHVSRDQLAAWLDLVRTLATAGFDAVAVDVLAPAWSSDWLSESGRRKLEAFGIAPPSGRACGSPRDDGPAACPRCGSQRTKKVSEFGSTPCKAHYRCDACLEPFDYFKCICILKFHPLVVASRAAVADDAIALTLAVPPGLRDEFRFRAGQHVALRQVFGGQEERRTYSIVSPEGADSLTIGVRVQPGGRMSEHLARHAQPGDSRTPRRGSRPTTWSRLTARASASWPWPGSSTRTTATPRARPRTRTHPRTTRRSASTTSSRPTAPSPSPSTASATPRGQRGGRRHRDRVPGPARQRRGGEVMKLVAALSKAFRKEGQSLSEFTAEYEQLTDKDKADFKVWLEAEGVSIED